MTPEVVLQALLAIWDELPGLVGPDWRKILPDLEALLARLKATQDPDATTDLVLTLRPYPAARSRLQAAAVAASASGEARRLPGEIRGGLVFGVGTVAAGPSLVELTDQLGSRLAETRRALPEAQASRPVRRLQTQVRDANGRPRDDGFVRGTRMSLRVCIAAEAQEGAMVAAQPFNPPVPGREVELEVVIQAGGATGPAVHRRLHLPATIDSEWTRPVPLAIPDRDGAYDVFVVVQYQGRTVQSARLSGPLLSAAANPGKPALQLSVDVSGVVDQTREEASQRSTAGASLVELPPLMELPQLFDAAGQQLFDSQELSRANDAVQAVLRAALGSPPANLQAASAPLTRLATCGAMLRNALRGKGAGFYDDADWVHITTFGPAHVPYELIYTHPQPANHTGVPICQPALDGAVGCSEGCADRDRADRVCPFGFWATSKVVERRPHVDGRSEVLADQVDVPVRSSAMVAVTKKADTVLAETSARIRKAVEGFSASVAVADSWDEVSEAADRGPTFVVWVTHTIDAEDPVEQAFGPYLELSGTTLAVIDVQAPYLNPDVRRPGPVVLALGCSTEDLAASFSSYETQLFSAHAEVVVTAICDIPGAAVASFVERLVVALGAVLDGAGQHRFGQAMTEARRATIRTGDLFALAVTSSGDGDVRLV
jgi:hypothetical protein